MELQITRAACAAMLDAAAASPDVEVCGLLLGDGTVVEIARACRNVATSPSTRFEIDPHALISAYKAQRAGGPAIMGCYHSHPNGQTAPSQTDQAMAEANGWIWVIIAQGAVRGWVAEKGGLSGRLIVNPVDAR